MQPVSIRFEKSLLDRLRRLAHAESLRRDADVSMADLIREAVLEAYPPDDHDVSMTGRPTALPMTETADDNTASGSPGLPSDLRGDN